MKKIKLLTLAIFSSTCFLFATDCDAPMHSQMFTAIKNSAVHKQSEVQRLGYVQGVVSRQCVSSDQAKELIVLFEEVSNRQAFFDYVKDHMTDVDQLDEVEALINN